MSDDVDNLTFMFPLQFLDPVNWRLLYKLSAQKLDNEKNPVLHDLWKAIRTENEYRSCGGLLSDHATVEIRLKDIPVELVTDAIRVIGELGNACAATTQFRATAFFTELIKEITRAICGPTDEQMKKLN